jgi:DNA-binding NarL/FixJ family response regulator
VSNSANHESHTASGRGTITTLIVDDSPRWVTSLRTFLSLHPVIEVVGVAGDGVEALAMIASLRPALVLLDIHMPTLGGLAAAPIIRDRFPEVQVVMMTAHYHAGLEAQCRASGARAIVAKADVRRGLLLAIGPLFPRGNHEHQPVSSAQDREPSL